MRQLAVTLGAVFLSFSQAWGAPPAYTLYPNRAGSHAGGNKGSEARQKYLDRNEGAYCTAYFPKLVPEQMSKLEIEPPKKEEWKTGAKYGDYLQNYFANACARWAGEMSFRGLGEPCGAKRWYSDDYSAGIEAGRKALSDRMSAKKTRLSYSYCEGKSTADQKAVAEAARADFLKALSTPVTGIGDRTGDDRREYDRGFVLGLCEEFANESCEEHIARRTMAEFWGRFDAGNREVVIDQTMRGPRRDGPNKAGPGFVGAKATATGAITK